MKKTAFILLLIFASWGTFGTPRRLDFSTHLDVMPTGIEKKEVQISANLPIVSGDNVVFTLLPRLRFQPRFSAAALPVGVTITPALLKNRNGGITVAIGPEYSQAQGFWTVFLMEGTIGIWNPFSLTAGMDMLFYEAWGVTQSDARLYLALGFQF